MAETVRERHLYIHKPLPGPGWTRIVHLEAGEFNDPVKCEVELINLNDGAVHPHYVALSYRWGDPDNITTIEVSGQRVSITRNLHDAIRRLRNRKSWLTFWADALSISQAPTLEGLEEKGAQVQMMSTIFPRATEVVVDLGHSDHLTSAAIGLMHRLARLPADMAQRGMLVRPNFQQYGIPDFQDPAWNAWMELKCRPWFNRVWMVQEFALAKQLKMMIGSYVIDGATMEIAHERSSNVQPPTTALITGVFSNETSLKGLTTMILVKQMYAHKQRLRLADLFGLCSGSQATNERDHIYALRGLVKDDCPAESKHAGEDELKVDYNESTEELAMRFARYLARRRPSSLIWTFAGGPHATQPSWTPSLKTNSLRMPTEGLFPSFEDQICLYKAAGNTQAQYDFQSQNGAFCLKTRACFVDTIKAASDTFDLGFHTADRSITAIGTSFIKFEHHARQMFVDNGFPAPFDEASGQCSDLYWRTLISDGDEHGRNRAAESFVDSFRAFATVSNMVKDDRTSGDIDKDPEQIALVVKMAPYLTALSRSMFGRKVCVTESGMVGNVTAGTEAGDRLMIVLGVEKPLIMRSVGVEGDLQYIGIAHVQGIMDGEAVGNGSWKVQDIRVV